MAIQIQGNGGVIAEVDGTLYRALRVSGRPLDYGALGSYSINLVTGTMAAGLAANAEIFQARWTDATRLCIVHDILFDGMGSIVAFAAGFAKFEAMIARSWSVDGSGGTAATLTGNNNKLRSNMGTTLFGAIRAASTAALTIGTKTLDSQGIGAALFGLPATAGAGIQRQQIFHDDGQLQQPIVLAQNEGLIVRATVPATGTWTGGVSMKWTEVTAY